MKNIIVGLFFGALFLPLSVTAAGSATMTFNEKKLDVQTGEIFDLSIKVNPNGEKLDTVRSVITFDPTILEVKNVSLSGSFNRNTPANGWDNKSGKISWGGFSLDGAVTSSTDLISITFLPLQKGNTTVKISGDSKAISNGEEKIDITSLDEMKVNVLPTEEIIDDVSLLVVNSSTHLNELNWYKNDSVEFNWTVLEKSSPIKSYYYSFDQKPDTDPSVYMASDRSSIRFDDVEDGVNYFHIKAVQVDGRSTPTVHRRTNVDVTAPNNIELTVSDSKLIEGESLWLMFATTDEDSGVAQYQVAINESDFQVQSSPMEITDLNAGTYFVRLAAIDKAGNSVYRSKSVRVYPKDLSPDRPYDYDSNSEIRGIVKGLSNKEEVDTDSSNDDTRKIIAVLAGLFIAGMVFLKIRNK